MVVPPTADCGLNSAGATVTVSGGATEFCYFLNGYLTVDLADASPELTVMFNTVPFGLVPALSIYLTDPAFEGLTMSKRTDSFTGGITGMLEGDRITLTWPGTVAVFGFPCEGATCHTATFELAEASVAPEPST